MTTHDFAERLAYSHAQADAPYWRIIYQQAFPDMIGCHDLRGDGWHQRAGRDRAIVLSSGKTVYIDEKVRSETWPDVAIEVWSTYPLAGTAPYRACAGAEPGWAVKPKDCDYIAYAFEPSQTCYLFPFLGICAAWAKHGSTWRAKAALQEDGYKWIPARNHRYQTISVAVPINALQSYIQDALTVTWRDAA